jgi:hypothetical protein
MVTKKGIKNIEAAINRIFEDIKDKKAGSGADKLVLCLLFNIF